jgi:hypothetical protein
MSEFGSKIMGDVITYAYIDFYVRIMCNMNDNG